MEKKPMRQSQIFAFLPVGSPSTATVHTIRVGHCQKRNSFGSPSNVSFRFHGLNQIREMLLLVDVEQDEATRAVDELKMDLRGPGTINTIEIKCFETFEQASDLGVSWFRTRLPLADVRACFYTLAKRYEVKHADEDRCTRVTPAPMMDESIWHEATVS